MKKQIIIPLSLLAILCSCGNNNQKADTQSKESKAPKAAKITQKQLIITNDFNQITSAGSVNIVYTQGDFNFYVEGDSSLLQHVETDVDSKVLTISIKTDRNSDLNIYEGSTSVTAYISAPELKCVALCSTGNFESRGTWKENSIQIGVIGSGSFTLDSISCSDFEFQSTGSGNATCKHISATEKTLITCMGQSNVTADVTTNELIATTQGGTINLTGGAKKKEFVQTRGAKIIDKTKKID